MVTRRELRSLVAQAVGDRIAEGTATSGGSDTLTDTNNLVFSNDDALNGSWAYIYEGTSSGDERAITDFDASSDQLTVGSNWSSTPDTTSKYEVHRKYRIADYNDAINAAIRASKYYLLRQVKVTSILTNGNLLNPLFSRWTDDTGTPADWTVGSSDVTQTVLRPGNTIGQSLKYECVVWSDSTDVRLEVTDGSTTATAAHDGSGFNLLTATLTASGTSVTVRLAHNTSTISTTTQEANNRVRGPFSLKVDYADGTVAYFDSVYAPDPFVVYRYPIDLSESDDGVHVGDIHAIHQIDIEAGVPGSSNPANPMPVRSLLSSEWTAGPGHLDPDHRYEYELQLKNMTPPGNRALTVQGMSFPSEPTADTDTIHVNNIEPLVFYAAFRLLQFSGDQRSRTYLNDYRQLIGETRVVYKPNSRIIRP